MSSYDELLAYTKQLERRLAQLERQESNFSVAGGDHGTLSGLGDDDHSIYLLASTYGGRSAFGTNWTDLTDAGATALHKHDHGGQDGLGDDDHSIYLLASTYGGRSTFGTNWTDLTDGGATTLHVHSQYLDTGSASWIDLTDGGASTLHKHDHGGQDGLGDDDHSQYALLVGRSGGQSLNGGTAANDDLTLQGTTNATRTSSYIILQPNGGNVGIGTPTPATKLSVLSGVTTANTATPLVVLGSDRNDYYASIDSVRYDYNTQLGLAFSTSNGGNAERMRIDLDGNVGIGTTTPGTVRLSIKGSTADSSASAMRLANSSDANLFIFRNDGASYFSNGQYLSPDSNQYTRWWTPGVAIGGVSGIGSYGHAFTYDVKLTAGAWKSIAGGYGLAFAFGEGSFTLANTNSFSGADQAVTWYDRLVVNSAGNVGIGTTAPDEKLHVAGGNTLLSNAYYYSAENSSGTNIRLAGMDSSNNVYLGAIDNAGGKVHIREDGADVITLHAANVGIGTTSPSSLAKLQVEGRVGIKTGVNAVSAQLFVYQDNNGATIPVLRLGQEDLSEEFIYFNATVGTGNPIDTAALGTYYGKIRVSVNGTFKYMALYNS